MTQYSCISGQRLIVNGFEYRSNGSNNLRRYWKCKSGCKATAISENGVVVAKSGAHDDWHVPISNTQIVVDQKVQTLKRKSTDHLERPIRKIYNDELREIPVDTEEMAVFPSFSKIDGTLYKRRAKLQPPLPENLGTLELTDVYKKTAFNTQFLLIDDGIGGNRLLVSRLPWPTFIVLFIRVFKWLHLMVNEFL
jgi:hypothetical protein